MISHSEQTFGRSSANRVQLLQEPGIEGARALLETFYYSFNNRNMDVFGKVWAEYALIQLNNPLGGILGGILRGYEPIAVLYQNIFNGPARVWVEFSDIVEFETSEMVVFAVGGKRVSFL